MSGDFVANIEHYTIVYGCHLCDAEFSNARNLREHYTTVEGKTYPSTKSKKYNTKTKKYISSSAARKRQNVTTNFGCPSCSAHYDTISELGTHLDEVHTPKTRPEVDTSFESLKNENKWTLSTGTVVEDQLYEFAVSICVAFFIFFTCLFSTKLL